MSSEKIYLQLAIKDPKLLAAANKVLKRWAVYDKTTESWDITEHSHIVRYQFDKVLPTGRWEYEGNQAVSSISKEHIWFPPNLVILTMCWKIVLNISKINNRPCESIPNWNTYGSYKVWLVIYSALKIVI